MLVDKDNFLNNFRWVADELIAPMYPSATISLHREQRRTSFEFSYDVRVGIELTYKMEMIVTPEELSNSRADIGAHMATKMYEQVHRDTFGKLIYDLSELRHLLYQESRPGSEAMKKINALIDKYAPQ